MYIKEDTTTEIDIYIYIYIYIYIDSDKCESLLGLNLKHLPPKLLERERYLILHGKMTRNMNRIKAW